MKKVLENVPVSKRILLWSCIVVVLLGVIHLTLQYVNINLLNEEFGPFFELTNRFDFDDEASIPTWVSQFIFLLIGFGSLFLVYVEKNRAKKAIWSTLTAIAFVGSLDEVATLHENVLQSIHLLFFDESASTVLANAWIIIIPFVVIAGALFTYKAFALLPKRTLQLLISAFVIYIVGAVMIDIITSSETTRTGFATQGVLVAIEELLELIGLIIALYAVTEYIERKYSKKLARAKKELLK